MSDLIKGYKFLLETVKELDKKLAEAEWIPCSDRLPSEDGLYLIQTNYTYHDIPNMEVYYWAEGWNCYRRCDGTVGRENEIDGIIAWMPLPKPYREEREDYELATEQMEHDAMYEPTYNPEDGSM